MPAAAAAVVGGVVGLYSARQQGKAAQRAANTQVAQDQAAIEQQQRQFDSIQKLLAPFIETGQEAMGGQKDLLGLNGGGAQGAAIQTLQQSPQFTALLAQGENSILQNASATGGLRGGNTQAALAQFSPQLLSATINDQYARLGGLSTIGLNAATQTGGFGQSNANSVSNLLQSQGAAMAGGALAQGKAQAGYANAITGALGMYTGLGGKF